MPRKPRDDPSAPSRAVGLLFAALGLNSKVDQNMLAALAGVPKSTVNNWVNRDWRRAANDVIDKAKVAGRLDAQGRVVEDNIPTTKPRAKKEGGGDEPLHGVKTGGIKKESKRGPKTGKKNAVKCEFDYLDDLDEEI